MTKARHRPYPKQSRQSEPAPPTSVPAAIAPAPAPFARVVAGPFDSFDEMADDARREKRAELSRRLGHWAALVYLAGLALGLVLYLAAFIAAPKDRP